MGTSGISEALSIRRASTTTVDGSSVSEESDKGDESKNDIDLGWDMNVIRGEKTLLENIPWTLLFAFENDEKKLERIVGYL